MGFWNHHFKGDDESEFGKLSLREYIMNPVVEGFSACVFYFAVLTFSTYYYTDVIGLSAGTIGLIITLSRCADGVTDLLAGMIIDKTSSKHGRCRAWFFWSSIPMAISMVILYSVPSVSYASQIVYVVVTYNFAVTISYTLNNMSWNLLGTFSTRDQKERDKLFSLRMGAANLSGALVSSITLPLVSMLGGIENAVAWRTLITIYAVLCYGLNVLGTYTIKERQKSDPTSRKNSKLDLPCTLRNPYFWLAIGIVGAYNVNQVATLTFLPYYAEYILGDPLLTTPISLISQGFMGVTGLITAYFLSKDVKKGRLIITGSFVAIVGQLAFLAFPTSRAILYISSAFRGIGFGVTGGCMFTFAGEAIEYGHWRFGHRAEATTGVANGIGNKTGVLIGGGITTILLGIAGYDGTLAVQSESALTMIRFVFGWSPVIFAAILIVLMLCRKMDRIHDTIMHDLAAGKFHPNAPYAHIAEPEAKR